jgi:hypothetical protein
MFHWFVPVYKLSETTDKHGFFVGFIDDLGYGLTFKILKNNLTTMY